MSSAVRTVSAATLKEWLLDGDELAVLDAREQGVYFDSHLFHAACVPLSTVELTMPRLVPRASTRIVWCDGGPDSTDPELAARAFTKATELGYTNCYLLQGGTDGWASNGGELYAGVNVPSKAFGEFVEHTYDTPRIPAAELKALIDANADMVILDSRPMGEFRRMSIPHGVDCPGAELVHRVKEVAPDPNTLVVVNCAGRTRSIIGAQSLLNAGLENRVVALENGTMGWELAGYQVARDHENHAPDPSDGSQVWSTAAAAAVGARFGVQEIGVDQLAEWQLDGERTTYLLDVRTPEEFNEGHLDGSLSAPGGQLVQATDEYVSTHNARLVLVDDNGVRATMTASWLQQLGWPDAVVLAGGIAGHELRTGPGARQSVPAVPIVKVAELADRLKSHPDTTTVLDLGSSLKYRKRGHIPGAWWGVRSRLQQARDVIGETEYLALTASDGRLAKLAVPEAAALWPDAEVVALAAGNKGWRHADYDMDPGFDRATTDANDVWYKPYDHDDDDAVEQHMRDYLTWEIALVEQLDRDPTVSFPSFD
ncbi:MAG: rhodanese-like domain-containing protein [Acidimicrobiales bacterium]|jgi:rhodanese-related sulfurtransferase